MAAGLVLSLISGCLLALALAPTSTDAVVLFPSGPAVGDSALPLGDDTFQLVQLHTPVVAFGHSYSELYVNVNGAVSFGFGVSQYSPTCGSVLGNPMVAPYWSDIDIRQAGNVYYREITTFPLLSANAFLLARVKADILLKFSDLLFNPTSLFVVTWDDSPFYNENCGGDWLPSGPRNTFQLVLATNGVKTYAYFIYDSLTWTTGTASGGDCVHGLGGVPAKVGFDKGDGEVFFALPNSCTDSVMSVATTSNMNINGQWLFQINRDETNACGVVQRTLAQLLAIFQALLFGTFGTSNNYCA